MLQFVWISVKEDSATVPLIVSDLLYFYVFELCSFTPFLLAFFVISSKNIALLNEVNRCVTSSSEYFLISNSLQTCYIKYFLISSICSFNNVIQIAGVSKSQVASKYIFMCVSAFVLVFCVYLCVSHTRVTFCVSVYMSVYVCE